ncbi:MAG: GNAT family N-acetyltransferase [Labilithrix sp.]|nr:GNAT family N-acetyltransferase [Labilithrix sp.]
MRSVRSLAFRTDLFLVADDGVVRERERYIVLETPSNPSFLWGNFLLYPEPPDADSHERWLDDHARELPNVDAVLLAWDRPDGAMGDVDRFVQRGFALDQSAILTASRVTRPPRMNDDVRVEPLGTDAQWEACVSVLTNAFAARRSGSVDDLRTFVVRQLERFKAMQAKKMGQWYGAYLDGELAGTLGLVRVASEAGAIGRFQLVGVDPRFGRRGVCSSLVYDVAHRALTTQGFGTLVMAADATYHAARVYESVGFARTELLGAVLRTPPAA